MYKYITLLVSFGACFVQNGLSETVTNVDILSLTDCDDEDVNIPDNLICQTEIVSQGSERVFNAAINLPFDLEDSLMVISQYNCIIKKWRNESWKPLKLTLKGSICEHVHKYLPGIWEKLSKSLNVPSNCPIKAGNYSVKDFTAESNDVNLPIAIPGNYLISVIVLKDNIPILCKKTELIISK